MSRRKACNAARPTRHRFQHARSIVRLAELAQMATSQRLGWRDARPLRLSREPQRAGHLDRRYSHRQSARASIAGQLRGRHLDLRRSPRLFPFSQPRQKFSIAHVLLSAARLLLGVQSLASFIPLADGQVGLLASLSELLDVALPAHVRRESSFRCRPRLSMPSKEPPAGPATLVARAEGVDVIAIGQPNTLRSAWFNALSNTCSRIKTGIKLSGCGRHSDAENPMNSGLIA